MGREPNMTELGALLDMETEEVHHPLELITNQAILDAPLDIDPTLINGDTVTDEDNLAPDSSVQEQPIATFVQQWLGELTDRYREVIERRFGLNIYNPHTLEQATADRGITRERVRQIQKEAMKSLGR